jgi:hypothetical protein
MSEEGSYKSSFKFVEAKNRAECLSAGQIIKNIPIA